MIRPVLFVSLVLAVAPAALASDNSTWHPTTQSRALPLILSNEERSATRQFFDALDRSDWINAAQLLINLPKGPVQDYATAELYLAKGSPTVELDPLMTLMVRAPWLPQGDRLAGLAARRGGQSMPDLARAQSFGKFDGPPRRGFPKSLNDSDSALASLDRQIDDLIQDDRAAEAEALLIPVETQLSPAGLAQAQTRIGWSYYIIGDNASAVRLGQSAANGQGEWAVHGQWLVGLASWRQGDCKTAGRAFADSATRGGDSEMSAGGYYWAARASVACGTPERAEDLLRNAARFDETFYGLLARSSLGMNDKRPGLRKDMAKADWKRLSRHPNVIVAAALSEIGESSRAGDVLIWQARISGAEDYEAIVNVAGRLGLPRVQNWLAYNAPHGVRPSVEARYPMPDWTPASGQWRVPPGLAYAHTLQESNFRENARSGADARGLMQVRPIAQRDIDNRRGGGSFGDGNLYNPSVNLDYGQSYLTDLSQLGTTGGLLPKVMAAYNAGPTPVDRWNGRPGVQEDPLLWIESISYRETRSYVTIVMRNYWMYETQTGEDSASRNALAQGLWPRFPGLPGATAVRMTPSGPTAVRTNFTTN